MFSKIFLYFWQSLIYDIIKTIKLNKMHYVARGDVLFLQQPKREGKMHFESETEIFIRKQNKTKSKDENMAFD
jgi:hypothetical protein